MEEHELISTQEFCTQHQLEMSFIYSLKEYGLMDVVNNEGNEYISPDQLSDLEKIVRLHYDLNVNMEGIDVILYLLNQLETAQKQVDELKNQLRFYR